MNNAKILLGKGLRFRRIDIANNRDGDVGRNIEFFVESEGVAEAEAFDVARPADRRVMIRMCFEGSAA